ncbi:hypothetical protein KUCAC02_036399 [Chaenocephalus aceratus]|nr:hypothetical protein KUCAC02_036399 [Chaenocephalus aceratus]
MVIDGTYIDKKCPFTGNVSIRGRILSGVVTKMKMQRTIVIRRDYLHYIRKYNRFEKRHKNISVHLSPCFRDVSVGDNVTVGECRPLSKTVRFNVLKAIDGTYIDKKCPFTGNVSIRGRILSGVVTKLKMQRTIVTRRDYLHYIRKYNRFEKRHKNISVQLSPCFRDVSVGDNVTVGECRPLSKTVRFNVLKAIDGTFIDKKCPFTGNVSIRGRILSGVVTKMKMQRTIVTRRDYLHYIRKYNRFEKRHKNISVQLSPCFRDVSVGDNVTVGECRPLSKTVRFNVLKAIDGTYIDKKCPFTGNVSIRGRILSGVVTKMKMQRTIVIRRDYLHYIRKYNRFEKRHKNISVHLSPCFRDVSVGDNVTVGECRPLSKTVRFNVLKVMKAAGAKKQFQMF